jgi:hypothetical protein
MESVGHLAGQHRWYRSFGGIAVFQAKRLFGSETLA